MCNNDHPLVGLYEILLKVKAFNFEFNPIKSNGKVNITTFLDKAIWTHKKLCREIELDMLEFVNDNEFLMHKNYHITLQNLPIGQSDYVNKHQRSLITKLKRFNVINYAE